jgi:hypothetical protein
MTDYSLREFSMGTTLQASPRHLHLLKHSFDRAMPKGLHGMSEVPVNGLLGVHPGPR